jgi:hypothetical protein
VDYLNFSATLANAALGVCSILLSARLRGRCSAFSGWSDVSQCAGARRHKLWTGIHTIQAGDQITQKNLTLNIG